MSKPFGLVLILLIPLFSGCLGEVDEPPVPEPEPTMWVDHLFTAALRLHHNGSFDIYGDVILHAEHAEGKRLQLQWFQGVFQFVFRVDGTREHTARVVIRTRHGRALHRRNGGICWENNKRRLCRS